jgi:hypothetical protein
MNGPKRHRKHKAICYFPDRMASSDPSGEIAINLSAAAITFRQQLQRVL